MATRSDAATPGFASIVKQQDRARTRSSALQAASEAEATEESSDGEDNVGSGVQGPEDDASVVGVSIGRVQTHLKDARTPAAEKAAAMDAEDGYFDSGFKTSLDPLAEPDENVAAQSSGIPSVALPSPWRAGPRTFERNSDTGGILGGAFRKRSSSGPERLRNMSIQLPSLPKNPRFFTSASPDKEASTAKQQPKSSTWQTDGPTSDTWNQFITRAKGRRVEQSNQSDSSLTPTETPELVKKNERNERAEEALAQDGRPTMGLRRATSDQSLYLARTLSKASSLGDDTRFEHVHEQVNSRLKAIRDSWQDSNLRRKLPDLPSLPKPGSVFSSSRTDLGDGIGSQTQRASGMWNRRSMMSEAAQHASASASPERSVVRSSVSSKMMNGDDAGVMSHPNFNEALENLIGDIVVLGGYRGSILRDAQPPHRRLWIPLKVGFNLRKVDLEVGFDDEEEARSTDRVIADGMLTHIGPVDISKRLFKRLRSSDNAVKGSLRVHDYGYDWRLNPHRLSRELIQFLETLPCNQPNVSSSDRGATVIAHSLGGLVTRHAMNQRPELFKGVVYAGVPETCVNILGPIRNGDDVLFSSKVLTAQVNLSIRTSIVLLPLSGQCFVDKTTKEEYPVDFYDVNDWIKYRLSPCTDPPLPAAAAPSKPTTLKGAVASMIPTSLTSALPSLPFMSRKDSVSSGQYSSSNSRDAAASNLQSQHAEAHAEGGVPNAGMAPQLGGGNSRRQEVPNPATGITISREKAIEYLTRVLPQIKQFRLEIAHRQDHQTANRYPPLAVIYGKSEPTVCGARVNGRDGIARVDSYDDLFFASGDGVVLAKAAQLPAGFKATRGGVVASERGHVTLLGDLEAVGKCLLALQKARRKGVGLGLVQASVDRVGDRGSSSETLGP